MATKDFVGKIFMSFYGFIFCMLDVFFHQSKKTIGVEGSCLSSFAWLPSEATWNITN